LEVVTSCGRKEMVINARVLKQNTLSFCLAAETTRPYTIPSTNGLQSFRITE
jgi:hypothetical protein